MVRSKGKKFESALEQLEKIVSRLEAGNLSLEDSLKHFEEGIKLAKACEERLNEAEQRVEVLKNGKRKDFEPEE